MSTIWATEGVPQNGSHSSHPLRECQPGAYTRGPEMVHQMGPTDWVPQRVSSRVSPRGDPPERGHQRWSQLGGFQMGFPRKVSYLGSPIGEPTWDLQMVPERWSSSGCHQEVVLTIGYFLVCPIGVSPEAFNLGCPEEKLHKGGPKERVQRTWSTKGFPLVGHKGFLRRGSPGVSHTWSLSGVP